MGSIVHSNGWCYLKLAQFFNPPDVAFTFSTISWFLDSIDGEGQTRIHHGGKNQLCFQIGPRQTHGYHPPNKTIAYWTEFTMFLGETGPTIVHCT